MGISKKVDALFRKSKKAEPVFPNTVYVALDDTALPMLVAEREVDGIAHNADVGVYELVDVRKVCVTTELV